MRLALLFFFIFSALAMGQTTIVDLGELPAEISETSGLLFYNNTLITHNDSGGEPILYEVDTLTREITRTVRISNIGNTDWEALSQDETYIYIGDFGNNLGTRQDLAIYRILKTDYLSSETVTAETIFFAYEDQSDFTDTGNSDWDAEAFFVLDTSLVVLTKQWKSSGSVAYEIPKTPGDYLAVRKGEIKNIGLVTDADYNKETGDLVILGYSSFLMPFIQIHAITDAIFSMEPIAIPVQIGLAQVEGLTQNGNGTYYFSSEFFSRESPNITSLSRLFSFTVEEEEVTSQPDPDTEPEPEPELNEDGKLVVFTEFGTGQIRYQINSEDSILGKRIYDVTGKTIWEQFNGEPIREGLISTPIPPSIYYFVVYFETSVSSLAFPVY